MDGKLFARAAVVQLACVAAAVVSGIAAGLVGVAIDHTLGLVVGVIAFGAACAGLRIREPAPMV